MRRKIELYIAGALADLSDQGLVLFNYAMTDLTKPTAVKNSYSKTVTLPGTPANDAIFSHAYRVDRAWEAEQFNPLTRTPFDIYDERGEILQSGYLKLDKVTRKGRTHTYTVSLYGGFGAFIYALMYDEEGNKRTLADLSYLTGASDELDFNITKANVQAAWNRLGTTPQTYDSKWDVINFAPAYNGIPDGDFSPDKGVANPTEMGVPSSYTEDGVTYSANNGCILVNLAQPHDEWAVKDLRCYLQRPVLSMRAFMVAVQTWASANGYTLDYSDIPATLLRHVWKTLPMLPSIGSFRQESGSLAATYTYGTTTSGDRITGYASFSGVTAAMNVTAKLNSCALIFRIGSSQGNPVYTKLRYRIAAQDAIAYDYHTVIFVQLLGYNGNTLLASSPVQCLADSEVVEKWGTPQGVAERCGFSPFSGTAFESAVRTLEVFFLASDEEGYEYYSYINGMEVRGGTINRLRLAVKCYTIIGRYNWTSYGGQITYHNYTFSGATETGMKPQLYKATEGYGTNPGSIQFSTTGADWMEPSASASYQTSSGLRSGAIIEKSKLLASKYTPADYLLSLGKHFGWVFRYEEKDKKLTILRRNTFYTGGRSAGIIDLTDRIDRGKDIEVQPLNAGARIYEFAPEIADGHFAKEYADIYGFGYGIQRVNTGYEFDGKAVDLLDGYVFRSAASIMENGPYWCYLGESGSVRPSVFIDVGNTYTLWAADGSNVQRPIPLLPSTTAVNYYNTDYHGYDADYCFKLDLHEADGKGVDGDDVLLRYCFKQNYPGGFHLTDDSAEMLAFNGGKPCWHLDGGSAYSLTIPQFSRYLVEDGSVTESLDFGTPKEFQAPRLSFDEDSPAYARYWREYLRDLLNKDTKVMKCRVHLDGLPVGYDLLRRFFWYEGAYWVLNKISNYSLTTWDPTECEFVQVRDISNYTSGQIW